MIDQAVVKGDLVGRLMQLGHPTYRPHVTSLFLVTGTRMKDFMSKRHAIIDVLHIASGKQIEISADQTFALTLFSKNKIGEYT